MSLALMVGWFVSYCTRLKPKTIFSWNEVRIMHAKNVSRLQQALLWFEYYQAECLNTGFQMFRLMVVHISCVRRQPAFCICKNKDADQLRGNLYYLNSKFHAASHLLWLYSPVCFRPGRKPRRQVLSWRGSYYNSQHLGGNQLLMRLTQWSLL